MRTQISRYTYTVGAIGLVLAFAVYGATIVLARLGMDGASLAVSDFGEAAVVALAAVAVLRTALSFGKGDRVRRYWLHIGAAIALFAVGDLVWSYIEVIQGADSFPSLADVFYVAQYLLFGSGVFMAARGYSGLVDIRKPFLYALGVSVVLAGGLYAALLRGIIADPELDAAAKALSLAYPVADLFLALLPALFIAFVAWHLGRGSFGWPWWPVALGLVVLAVSDSGFAWLDAQGLYNAGNIVDAGWMIAQVLVAIGALVARDVFGVAAVAAPSHADAAA